MKKVNYLQVKEELDQLNERFGDIGNRAVSLYELPASPNAPLQIGVNWAAAGTKDVLKTRCFISQLELACSMASTFKYNGYIVDYTIPADQKRDS